MISATSRPVQGTAQRPLRGVGELRPRHPAGGEVILHGCAATIAGDGRHRMSARRGRCWFAASSCFCDRPVCRWLRDPAQNRSRDALQVHCARATGGLPSTCLRKEIGLDLRRRLLDRESARPAGVLAPLPQASGFFRHLSPSAWVLFRHLSTGGRRFGSSGERAYARRGTWRSCSAIRYFHALVAATVQPRLGVQIPLLRGCSPSWPAGSPGVEITRRRIGLGGYRTTAMGVVDRPNSESATLSLRACPGGTARLHGKRHPPWGRVVVGRRRPKVLRRRRVGLEHAIGAGSVVLLTLTDRPVVSIPGGFGCSSGGMTPWPIPAGGA